MYFDSTGLKFSVGNDNVTKIDQYEDALMLPESYFDEELANTQIVTESEKTVTTKKGNKTVSRTFTQKKNSKFDSINIDEQQVTLKFGETSQKAELVAQKNSLMITNDDITRRVFNLSQICKRSLVFSNMFNYTFDSVFLQKGRAVLPLQVALNVENSPFVSNIPHIFDEPFYLETLDYSGEVTGKKMRDRSFFEILADRIMIYSVMPTHIF
jgi:hypothetical protein